LTTANSLGAAAQLLCQRATSGGVKSIKGILPVANLLQQIE
jgi:hypothetical protein